MWTVYIIKSEGGLFYRGITRDLKKRLSDHNTGINKWTKRGNNWKLIYSENYRTAKEARIREKYFKNTAGREWLRRRGII
ncbi:MAG: GIY-YIG nuclease family protein [Candidatus Marinimicrobia bacterium]|nr:GIY-YIG nuclease family protein [Candidatus Neomarinimicrobiota bacterium]